MTADDWREHAACRDKAPMFDPPPPAYTDAAKRRNAMFVAAAAAVCAGCPVQAECLADYQRGRDEGIRAGRLLPPVSASREHKKKAS